MNKGIQEGLQDLVDLMFNTDMEEVMKEKSTLEYIHKLQQENKQLKEKLNTYENPDDMTLMFMWCDEKAKDKIKELTQALLDIKEYIGEPLDNYWEEEAKYILDIINKALGDKENE